MRRLAAFALLLGLVAACATQKPKTEEELQAEKLRFEARLDQQIAQYQKRPSKVFVSGSNAGKYQPYARACLARIVEKGNLAYPEEARGRLYGSVRVTFSVRRSGALETVEIDRSSGYPVLDTAIVSAIRSAAPFDPLPADFGSDLLVVTQTFHYTKGDDGALPTETLK